MITHGDVPTRTGFHMYICSNPAFPWSLIMAMKVLLSIHSSYGRLWRDSSLPILRARLHREASYPDYYSRSFGESSARPGQDDRCKWVIQGLYILYVRYIQRLEFILWNTADGIEEDMNKNICLGIHASWLTTDTIVSA